MDEEDEAASLKHSKAEREACAKCGGDDVNCECKACKCSYCIGNVCSCQEFMRTDDHAEDEDDQLIAHSNALDLGKLFEDAKRSGLIEQTEDYH